MMFPSAITCMQVPLSPSGRLRTPILCCQPHHNTNNFGLIFLSCLRRSHRTTHMTRTPGTFQSPAPTFLVGRCNMPQEAPHILCYYKATTTKNNLVPSTWELTTHGQTICLLTCFSKTITPSRDLRKTVPGHRISPVTLCITTVPGQQGLQQRMQPTCSDRSSCLRANCSTNRTHECQMSSSRFISCLLPLWPPWIIVAVQQLANIVSGRVSISVVSVLQLMKVFVSAFPIFKLLQCGFEDSWLPVRLEKVWLLQGDSCSPQPGASGGVAEGIWKPQVCVQVMSWSWCEGKLTLGFLNGVHGNGWKLNHSQGGEPCRTDVFAEGKTNKNTQGWNFWPTVNL